MEIPDKVSKELYSISAELSIAICDPMSLTLDDRIDWLIELKKDYLKRFGKEFNYISKFISLMNNSNDDSDSDDDNSIEINKYYNEDDDDNIVFVKFDKEKERNKDKDKEGFWRWIENESSSQSDNNDDDNVDDNIEIRSNDSDNFDYNNFDYNNFDYDNYDQWILSLNNNDNSNQLSSFM